MLIIIVVVGGHILLYAQTPRMDEVEKRREEGRKGRGEGKGRRKGGRKTEKIPPANTRQNTAS